jgi:hypothetical protein
MGIFAALGALAFPSYRRSNFSSKNAHIFAVFTREATTRGSQQQLQNFSDRLPANADLKTCKHFNVIHGFLATFQRVIYSLDRWLTPRPARRR